MKHRNRSERTKVRFGEPDEERISTSIIECASLTVRTMHRCFTLCRVMGFTLFPQEPTSQVVRAFLGRALATSRVEPNYRICDKGPQFCCHGFKSWCRRTGIRPRFGATGKHGSIAVVDPRYIDRRLDAETLWPCRPQSLRVTTARRTTRSAPCRAT